jgi:hypothetical protein
VESGSLIELKAEGYETSFTRLGKVRAQGLAIKKATGHAKISIRGNGLNITLKKQSKP